MRRRAIAAALGAAFFSAPVFAYDSIQFSTSIPIVETGQGVAATFGADRMYILDAQKHCVEIYDLSGKFLKTFGRSGDGDGEFNEPKGLAVSETGIYVADTGNNRVEVFDKEGKFISSFGAKGSQAGSFKKPSSVTLGSDGRVYVSDSGNDRVSVFAPEGILLFQFGVSGSEARQLNSPEKVVVDASDNIYVLDKKRLQKFDPTGQYVEGFPRRGDDFVVDSYGFVYALDRDSGKVTEQSPAGSVLGRFGSRGSGLGQFQGAQSLALDGQGRLFILDSAAKNVIAADISEKLRGQPLAPSTRTKLSVSGPVHSFTASAGAISVSDGKILAYLPKAGQFAFFDETGAELGRFGTGDGKGPEVTHSVGGLAQSAKGGIFAADEEMDRLERFDSSGHWQANIAESQGFFDSKKKEGRLKRPKGVAINDKGTIYVADAGNRRVDAFSAEGVFLFPIGPQLKGLELQEPVDVAWDAKGRFVYILDRGLKRVVKCEPSGAFLSIWGKEGDGAGEFRFPEAFAFDGRGHLFILDSQLKRVSVYFPDGRWITDMFASGSEDRDLKEPNALAVEASRLWVSDKGSSRIVSFDLHPLLAAPVSISSSSREGTASLSWTPVDDDWAAGYYIFRSSRPWSGYEKINETRKAVFEDSTVSAYERYFYRLATKARNGDGGAMSLPIEVFVAGEFNRAPVEISTVSLGNIFSANYKWYLKHPLGQAVVTNNVQVPFQKVKLSFRLKDFMDFGYDTEIPRIEPGQKVSIPLIATLNNKILDVTEDTPLQAELTLTYFEEGAERKVSLSRALRLYARNAITWEDPARIANFVTPNDTPVMDFQRAILHDAPVSPEVGALHESVVTAMHFWDALSELGVKYFANPKNPFESVRGDQTFPVDYTQFPRETLQRKSGQCDDLTTLFSAMLDVAGVKVAILDYPGHMAFMFDTGEAEIDSAMLPEDDLVLYNGTYWVPVEPTLVGEKFEESVRKAAFAYKTENAKGAVTVVDLHSAWENYEPVTMPATEWRSDLPDAAALAKRFSSESAAIFGQAYSFFKKRYEAQKSESPNDPQPRLELGLLEQRAGHAEKAKAEFDGILAFDPQNASALSNLGSLAFMEGNYTLAEARYIQASAADSEDSDILINLAQTEAKLKNKDKIREYGDKAVALDPLLKPLVQTLTEGL